VMLFGVAFRKVGSTMFNNLVVPAMIFVHTSIYQTTCMRRT
jgi:hypothetical protein